MSLSQGLHQKLLQKLSPQQIQLMKLLQVPTAILEERIKEELEENPALEVTEDHEEGSGEELKKKTAARTNTTTSTSVNTSATTMMTSQITSCGMTTTPTPTRTG